MINLTSKDGAVTFGVRVQPRAARSEIVGELDGALKVRLTAPPVDGAANEELIKLLAKFFAVARGQVTILSGATAKQKLIRVTGIRAEVIRENLVSATNGKEACA